ncbi:Yos1-like protein [Gonapodya prolifera JEL478]|uniref:Yos1-like protein n=1 Tax=Gonapodya prolifera (strain JEL478) TaxID=1344416 RepID=A0A139AUE6_GONPJ|nr:Yos1-like protein [Gonapodya prolifera JEL478]|eukprot:KXS20360.1 Yos1-like protein [Gonapodya prolifera JEL478]
MAFTLGQLLYAIVLFINGVAILHEERFLARIGWSTRNADGFVPQTDPQSLKTRLVTLIAAIRTLLRLPLILANVLIITYEIILG